MQKCVSAPSHNPLYCRGQWVVKYDANAMVLFTVNNVLTSYYRYRWLKEYMLVLMCVMKCISEGRVFYYNQSKKNSHNI